MMSEKKKKRGPQRAQTRAIPEREKIQRILKLLMTIWSLKKN